jgi:hypothetical protein
MRFIPRKKLHRILLVALAATLLALFVPAPAQVVPPPAAARPFLWDQDDRWQALEAHFDLARREGCVAAEQRLADRFRSLENDVDWLRHGSHGPGDARFDLIENSLFETASLLGACPDQVSSFITIVGDLRTALKVQSRSWDLSQEAPRGRLYRILYGSRMAVEELLLQSATGTASSLVIGTNEPSETPSAVVEGVRVHSGDILVSRGGAPTSALIARGNDYPGNFSHIALLHISEAGEITVIEAHIEVGVVSSSLETYLRDKKLRIMVLRLDHALDALRGDPMLPHRAAELALEEARTRHVPYDFAMRYADPGEKFCSEVASAPYGDLGVDLWEGLTSMSSRGVTSWLSRLGVTQFETHGPSDLEYDPKMVVVAEWRDAETLFDDHVDTAIVDALLEGAERGDELDYDYRMLPLARLAKAYSVLRNMTGSPGPVPEGMSATRALRAQWLTERHAAIKQETLSRVEAFRRTEGYTPPYWDLVALAREALANTTD